MEASHPGGQYLWRNDSRFFLQKQNWRRKEKESKYNSRKDQNISNTPYFTILVTVKRKQLQSKDKKTISETTMKGIFYNHCNVF